MITKPQHPKINPNHPLAKGLVMYWPVVNNSEYNDNLIDNLANVQPMPTIEDLLFHTEFRDKIRDRMGDSYG